MSDTATDLVWSSSKSRRGSRLVMLALARKADHRGKVSLTLDDISESTRLTTRAITKCLGDLTALGEISYERGGGSDNPNSYTILLVAGHEDGTEVRESSSQNDPHPASSGNSRRRDQEVSSSRTRGGSTPYGSTTTTKKQASLSDLDPVDVPEGASGLVKAITSAGLLVGWRLTESEWARVTALAATWGHDRLVELVARRWNTARPPQSARYLLRIWADLPAQSPTPAAGSNLPGKDNVVPLRRQSGGWAPFQNTAKPSAYENGF
ncbi:hypothetical protein [Streptomyces paludis]|uniref:hypothetical protein n=1 Tax=Streptomyces paludis TaxID=2282738 RepID=UPI0013B3FE22|nr:hypothetical protein [Streptomyces paludis]